MSEIPADIGETVRLVRKRVQNGVVDLRHIGQLLTGKWDQDFPAALLACAENFEAAISTERARCAAIAEQPHPHDARRPFWSQGKSIAAAIRNGEEPD